MSYCSENKLPLSTPISRLIEVICLLGYNRVQDSIKNENEIASFMWFGNDESISFVGIELNVYREPEYISVQTRTRVGRSFLGFRSSKQNHQSSEKPFSRIIFN